MKNAIILAAGCGIRMVPINTNVPKGLLEVQGEKLIERIIKQLHEAAVTDIYIVVGYMKEQYEYLIDKYQVRLIVNMEYSTKNNLHSLAKALLYLSNSYIIPCDVWCKENPFHTYELYSWYLVSEENSKESRVRVNEAQELIQCTEKDMGNRMSGICYLQEKEAQTVRRKIASMDTEDKYNTSCWEDSLYENGKMIVAAKVVHTDDIVEINTYEQLRTLDQNSQQLNSKEIMKSAQVLNATAQDIVDITILKKGMTNRSFLFTCKKQRYIMRIPGEGTDQLINRRQEAEVYRVIKHTGICDEVLYLNPINGYKITKYIENAHTCNALNIEEVSDCIQLLKKFHGLELKVDYFFDIFGQIQYYENLRNGLRSVYADYVQTKRNIFSLRSWLEKQPTKYCLVHIDAVPDNFLFSKETDGTKRIQLIDWEYAGMQDPHVDIAMFCIYALYDKKQVDRLVDMYFNYKCPDVVRIKIYYYIALGGLLWSNWCEYKCTLGVEFGKYAIYQYQYAKEYYSIVHEYLLERGELDV